jgi:DNA repair ATPase RecN
MYMPLGDLLLPDDAMNALRQQTSSLRDHWQSSLVKLRDRETAITRCRDSFAKQESELLAETQELQRRMDDVSARQLAVHRMEQNLQASKESTQKMIQELDFDTDKVQQTSDRLAQLEKVIQSF